MQNKDSLSTDDPTVLARKLTVEAFTAPYRLSEGLYPLAYAAVESDDRSLSKEINDLTQLKLWEYMPTYGYGYSLLWLAIQLNNSVLLETCVQAPKLINHPLYYLEHGPIGGVGLRSITPLQGFLYTFMPIEKFLSERVYSKSLSVRNCVCEDNIAEKLRILRLFIKHGANTKHVNVNFLSDLETHPFAKEYKKIKALIALNNYWLNLKQEINSPCYAITLFFKENLPFLRECGFFSQEKKTKLSAAGKILEAVLDKDQITLQELNLTPQEENAIMDGRLKAVFEQLMSASLIQNQTSPLLSVS